MARDLIALLREQRRSWVYLQDDRPEKAISFLRPPETDMPKLAQAGVIGLDQVVQYVDGWRGITPDDIVPGCGISEPAAFTPDLLREWLADNGELMSRIAQRIAQAISDHLQRTAAAAKN